MIKKLPKNIDRFYISDNEWISIKTRTLPLNFVYNCYDIDIAFQSATNEFIFGATDALTFCSKIKHKAFKLLNNQLILPPKMQGKLGMLNNNYFMGILEEDHTMDYYFFGNSHIHKKPYFDSFLYNDLQHNIVFEITPAYPWNDEDNTHINHPDFISYSEFIKNYQPTIIRTINPNYLHHWLEQINILEPLFEKNEIDELHQSTH